MCHNIYRSAMFMNSPQTCFLKIPVVPFAIRCNFVAVQSGAETVYSSVTNFHIKSSNFVKRFWWMVLATWSLVLVLPLYAPVVCPFPIRFGMHNAALFLFDIQATDYEVKDCDPCVVPSRPWFNTLTLSRVISKHMNFFVYFAVVALLQFVWIISHFSTSTQVLPKKTTSLKWEYERKIWHFMRED